MAEDMREARTRLRLDLAQLHVAAQRRALGVMLQHGGESEMPRAASVFTGPAEMALTRIPRGPRSAPDNGLSIRVSLATPMTCSLAATFTGP